MSPNALTLLDLPDEILLIIGEHITSESDLNAFHRTNRHLYRILDGILYRSNALYHEGHALFWAISYEQSTTAKKSVLAGTTCKGAAPWPFNWTSGQFSRQYAHTRALVSPTGWIEEPLFVACRNRKPTIVQTLLELGAHSKYQPERMLYLAAASGWSEIVKVLLEHGVSVDPGYVDTTPLTLAIMNGQSEIAEVFFRYGSGAESRSCQFEQLSHPGFSENEPTSVFLVS
jgi:Ankyrin repeats (3 copies)